MEIIYIIFLKHINTYILKTFLTFIWLNVEV